MPLTRVPSRLLDTANAAINVFMTAPANGTYMLCQYMPYSGNLVSVTSQCNVGTANALIQINGAAAYMASGNVGTTQNTNATVGVTAFTTGQNLSMLLTNTTTTCANLAVTVFLTRSGA